MTLCIRVRKDGLNVNCSINPELKIDTHGWMTEYNTDSLILVVCVKRSPSALRLCGRKGWLPRPRGTA